MKQHILVIEDDEAIRCGVVDALELDGYQVSQADCASTGIAAVGQSECDIVLLDLVLPDGDGLDVLAEIRSVRPKLPVIILTARGEEPDRVRGLRLGADDYVVKPFSVQELTARIEAVLRRATPDPCRDQLPVPCGIVDLRRCELIFEDGSTVELSEREVDILRYLASRAGEPVSRDELMAEVWKIDPRGIQSRTIDMHIARLREKLRDSSAKPTVIRTVRGRGYSFELQRPALHPEAD